MMVVMQRDGSQGVHSWGDYTGRSRAVKLPNVTYNPVIQSTLEESNVPTS